jgi:transposase-like protein
MSAAEVQTLAARKTIAYQDYSEEFKASIIAAIEANNGNVHATAKLFNVPSDTVRYWWANSERFREIQAASSENLANKLEHLAHSCADSLAEHDFSIVAARDKAAVMAVAIDKMQLLRGQPTEIVENVESHKVLVLLAGALGVEDKAIVTPTVCGVGEVGPQETIAEVP